MNIPSDYVTGYLRARTIEPEMASNYIAHTTIGDPEADAVIEALSALGPGKMHRLTRAGIEGEDEGLLDDAPPLVRDFFQGLGSPPAWVDFSAFTPGIRMFHRNSKLILGAFVGGVLIEGFSTNISKSFHITGRVRHIGTRRLQQNNRQMIEVFMPGGLKRQGDGWKLSVRVRLVHAQVRWLLAHSEDWDARAWGVPISAAHVGYAITAFSARLLKHMRRLGATYDREERDSFMEVWRYTGFLMGIPETILFRDRKEALQLFEIGGLCEPSPSTESAVMAHSLVNSAPVVGGITDPASRQKLAKYVYSISRALIGPRLADALDYPKGPTLGVLFFFRLEDLYHRIMNRIFPKHSQGGTLANFTSLLEVAVFDSVGISYKLPDHVYAEESSEW